MKEFEHCMKNITSIAITQEKIDYMNLCDILKELNFINYNRPDDSFIFKQSQI